MAPAAECFGFACCRVGWECSRTACTDAYPPPPKTQSHRRHAAWERDSWRKEDGKAPKSDQAAKGKAGHDSELKSKAKDMPSTSERLLAQGVSCGGAPC